MRRRHWAMLPVGSVTDMIVGMLAQQGVEKSIKAVLAARGVDFPFTHDIGGLARICAEAEAPLPDDLGEADQLTPYAGALRYDAEDAAVVLADAVEEAGLHAQASPCRPQWGSVGGVKLMLDGPADP
jgi:hypothetical protein